MDLYMRKEVIRASKYEDGIEDTWVPMFAESVHPDWVYKVHAKDGVVLVAALVDITGHKTFIKRGDMIVHDGDMKYPISSEDFHKRYKKVGR